MIFKGIEHFTVAAANTIDLSKWYCKIFGFKEVYNNQKNPPTIFIKGPDGSMIEFIGKNENQVGKPDPKEPGWRHIAISVDKIEEGIEVLDANGVEWMGELKVSERSGTKARFFRDIEGNIVHLIERENKL
ncbi:MAG: VOC family protein [Candidatus Ranarchaeia archaeon]